VADEPNPLPLVGWSIVVACLIGLLMRGCEPKAPDYGCVETVTPWGVECG
jgi:hypothetical protein